ncbi:MAG: hypothetical protein M0C28_41705 [Candidatus Moduliflexus flocculans]|nr:hypothetical protein [Candidatus Moduliflexus flocculans]
MRVAGRQRRRQDQEPQQPEGIHQPADRCQGRLQDPDDRGRLVHAGRDHGRRGLQPQLRRLYQGRRDGQAVRRDAARGHARGQGRKRSGGKKGFFAKPGGDPGHRGRRRRGRLRYLRADEEGRGSLAIR